MENVLIGTSKKEDLQLQLQEQRADIYSSIRFASNPEIIHKVLTEEPFKLVILDANLGISNCLELIESIKRSSATIRMTLCCGQEDVHLAVQAYQKGISSIISEISEGLPKRRDSELSHSNGLADIDYGIIGESKEILEVIDRIKMVARIDSKVLITGETGTGNELVAKMIHRLSDSKNGPFVGINCGAIPGDLLESELFGYKKGAFTGAKSDRKGLFETAGSGLTFLDEIGDMPLDLQVKLLRVLQENEMTPLGSKTSVKIKCRMIAATNKDLATEVLNERFRADLFFRLNVISIHIPPLRTRRADIIPIFNHFVDLFSNKYKVTIKPVKKSILNRITANNWPGNVRELENAVERAIVMSSDGNLMISTLFPDNNSHRPLSKATTHDDACLPPDLYQKEKDQFEVNYLVTLLRESKGNISEAARISGQHRANLYRMMKKHGIPLPLAI